MSPITRFQVAATVAAMSLPDALVRALVAFPEEIHGQPLDLRTRWFLTLLRLDHVERHTRTVQQQREDFEYADLRFASEPSGVDITAIEVPLAGRTLAARAYRPRAAGPAAPPSPAMLYLHGGGFATGSPLGYDGLCSRLVREGGCVVVSLDYRLAPEHPFPAAVDDAVDTFRWLRAQANALGLDASRLAIGGDSAGGTLSAVVCNTLDANECPALQLLIYPGTDIVPDTASRARYARGFYMSMAHVRWFYDTYTPNHLDRLDPRASPMRAPEVGRVPAIVVIAGLDTLADEGRAYANRLANAGVDVDTYEVSGLPHGFVSLDRILPSASLAVSEMCRRVRHRLSDR
ncbi:alpha/beta hydrolase [Deltaproteobacteria bacterium]|nr:alpha/beta hydrolase [Deltaproteobacteria bacterium]